MGPNTINKKKTASWTDSLTLDSPNDSWTSGLTFDEPESTIDLENIDSELEAPALVHAEVGAMEKPEDQLAVLKKHYPYAQPYGDGNFVMTDPVTKKTMLFNREGWIPNGPDFARNIPEISEGVGALLGGAAGAIFGSPSGPGAVATAVGGAGAGGTVFREGAQRGINWFFGNDDTRTGTEQLVDAGKTFALNAAGEGVGRGVAAGGSKLFKYGMDKMAGKADDVAAAAQRLDDAKQLGLEPTAGMVSLDPKVVKREAYRQQFGGPIADRVESVPDILGANFERTLNEIGTPGTFQSAGAALQDSASEGQKMIRARINEMYGETTKTIGTNPATGKNTTDLLTEMRHEQKQMGATAKLNNGAEFKEVITHADALAKDIKANAPFSELQDARTQLGRLANNSKISPFQRQQFQRLYESISADMAETARISGDDAFKQWKEADAFYSSQFKPDGGLKVFGSVLKSDEPGVAFKKLVGEAKQGDTRLSSVKKHILDAGGQDSWNQVAATYLQDLGAVSSETQGHQFSAKRFLNGYRNLAPEAKSVLFEPGHRESLDRIARAIENDNAYKAAGKGARKRNDSAITRGDLLRLLTGGGTWAYTGDPITGAVTSLGLAGAKAGAGKVANSWSQHMLTNPIVAAWAAQIPKAAVQREGLKKHLFELAQIARRTPEMATRIAINDYLRAAGYQGSENE